MLALAFGSTSILLLKRLKKFFPEFYQQHKCLLFGSTFGLTVPLFARFVYDGLLTNKAFACFVMEYEFQSNVLAWVFLDLIPIILQMSSMIFGWIRHKNEKKKRAALKQALMFG